MATSLYGFKNDTATRPTRPQGSGRSVVRQPLTSDERAIWDERVAIAMADGKVTQAEAERLAWQQVERARQTKPPTVLKHCRCNDCKRFSRDGQHYHCDAGIGGTKVRWSDGHRECDPAPDAWHYCAEYLGPRISPHTFVWRYDDMPQQAADVGPRSHVAGEAANHTNAADRTPRGPTSRDGQCEASQGGQDH